MCLCVCVREGVRVSLAWAALGRSERTRNEVEKQRDRALCPPVLLHVSEAGGQTFALLTQSFRLSLCVSTPFSFSLTFFFILTRRRSEPFPCVIGVVEKAGDTRRRTNETKKECCASWRCERKAPEEDGLAAY